MSKIYLLNSYELLCRGVRDAMTPYTDLEWLGSQHSIEGLMEALEEKKPDIFITDLLISYNQPRVDMAKILPEIRKRFPDMKVAMYTMFNQESLISYFKKHALADAWITMNTDSAGIYQALKMLGDGKSAWPEGV